jgi:hypothetical protein
MKKSVLKLSIMAAMLIGLPLAGISLTAYPLARYLEFPPRTQFVFHASFSWIVFVIFLFLIILFTAPFIIKGKKALRVKPAKKMLHQKPFPWWGWIGMLLLVVSWTIAWTRMPAFEVIQEYTFTPLWLTYIIIVNAVTYRRTGHCMMLDRPLYFLFLFPFSAGFWWFFEYLNRFVQNWYYVGAHYEPLKYFLLATISFSTVLPAVLGTRDLLMSTQRINKGFRVFFPINPAYPRVLAISLLLLSGFGLACVGIFPDYLFPLLWMAPLLIILSLQALFKEKHILSDIAGGNWSTVVAAAFSALICGIFWEMWNYYSMVKWEYSVPLVHRFKIFEMPILGYAGYLPFGLECAVIGSIISSLFKYNYDG